MMGVLSDVASDFADLFRTELELARAEITQNLMNKAYAGIWMSAAGVLGLIALLLLAETAVFWIASAGIATHWACLIVAVVFIILGGIAYLKGRSDAEKPVAPVRTLHQVRQDIETTREQLS